MNNLRSVTYRVDIDIDPITFAGDDGIVWMHDGFALAGQGQATTIRLGAATTTSLVDETLGRIESRREIDRIGTGPVALGALAFARSDDRLAGTLVVPQLLYGRDRDGNRWISWVGDSALPDVTTLVDQVVSHISMMQPVRTPTCLLYTSDAADE